MLAGTTIFQPRMKRKKINPLMIGSVLIFFALPSLPDFPVLPGGLLSALSAAPLQAGAGAAKGAFQVAEATIHDIHNAIQTNQITCRQLTQLFVNRAKAYNGVCTQLVTEQGTALSPATGVVRAGAAIKFPAKTVAASSLYPDFDKYAGTPLDFGRMAGTISDPTVKQQFGMGSASRMQARSMHWRPLTSAAGAL